MTTPGPATEPDCVTEGRHYAQGDMMCEHLARIHFENIEKAQNFLVQSNNDTKVLAYLEKMSNRLKRGTLKISGSQSCKEIQLLTSRPEFNKMGTPDLMTRYLGNVISRATSKLMIDTPYFIPRKKTGGNFLKKLLLKGVQVDVFSNSLQSSDSMISVAGMQSNSRKLKRAGLKLATYNAWKLKQYLPEYYSSQVENAVWGIHTKAALVYTGSKSENATIIGSYNVDPRSFGINKEMAIVCKGSDKLFNSVKKSMDLLRQQNSKTGKKRPLKFSHMLKYMFAKIILTFDLVDLVDRFL